MSINPNQLKMYVVRPTLQKLDLWSEAAENLLMGTAAQESQLGLYLHQVDGVALGIYQMEPETHDDLWKNFLPSRPKLIAAILKFSKSNPEELVWNLAYATAMTRIHYLRISEALPAANDIKGLGLYWKKYYNTEFGKGTVQEFVNNYGRYVNQSA